MKKLIKKVLISIVLVLIVGAGGFFIYTLDYYRVDFDEATLIENGITMVENENYIVQYPSRRVVTKGLIFYPGGKVEHKAYIPLLRELSRNGYLTVVVDMPFNLAVFDTKAADDVIPDFPGIETWYIGGHSLGGAMASSYLAKSEYEIEGLVLLAAYPVEEHGEDVLVIYGENDEILDSSKVDQSLDPVIISGGNHAFFGNYGLQKNDGIATISREEQQDLTIGHIVEFIEGND